MDKENKENKKNKKNKDTLKIDESIFTVLSFVFLFIFAIYSYRRGVQFGFLISIFIWAFFVTSVPIPQVALLLAFPVKHFFKISMFISQTIISIFACCILIYFYFYKQNLILKNKVGKLFIKIINKRAFLLFILSIIASIIGTYILDNLFDVLFFKGELIEKKQRKYKQILILFILFLLLNIWYLNYCLYNNIQI